MNTVIKKYFIAVSMITACFQSMYGRPTVDSVAQMSADYARVADYAGIAMAGAVGIYLGAVAAWFGYDAKRNNGVPDKTTHYVMASGSAILLTLGITILSARETSATVADYTKIALAGAAGTCLGSGAVWFRVHKKMNNVGVNDTIIKVTGAAAVIMIVSGMARLVAKGTAGQLRS